jgi:Flp pilus assembly protein TadG
MIYTVVALVAIMMIVSLAVDFGRAKLVKAELQSASDAAALYGATGLPTATTVRSRAQSASSAQTADGYAVTLTNSDIEIGVWNTSTRVFTVTSTSPNAVRVTARRVASRNTAVPTMFAQLLGLRSVDVTASTIVRQMPASSSAQAVSSKRSIWYHGLADGTQIPDPWGYDVVDSTSRPLAIDVTPGQVINFTNGSGSATYSQWGGSYCGIEGNPGSATLAQPQYANGFADLAAPSVSLIGAFVDASTPSSTSAPASLDYSTEAARDVATLSPQLKQPFFIGTGATSSGAVRSYTVPQGATKLLLGVHDSYVWRDNDGTFNITVNAVNSVQIVR